jgi:hypothetical protein
MYKKIQNKKFTFKYKNKRIQLQLRLEANQRLPITQLQEQISWPHIQAPFASKWQKLT